MVLNAGNVAVQTHRRTDSMMETGEEERVFYA